MVQAALRVTRNLQPETRNMSKQAIFRFYEELNDFLPRERRKREIQYSFEGNPSVKDAIESLGVPHPEVDLILVNGEAVSFTYRIEENDCISVYPQFETLNITGLTGLRDRALRISRFILDVHLGKLARYLRALGFDTAYDREYEDREIAERSVKEGRILLTRDVGLLKHRNLTRAYWLRSQYPMKQLREIMLRFDLFSQMKPFSRCIACNGSIFEVNKKDVADQLQVKTRKYYDVFYRCSECGKIYWQGSHYERMKTFVDSLEKETYGKKRGVNT